MNATTEMPERTMTLTGWGRYPAVPSRVRRPERLPELLRAVDDGSCQTLLARGAGRSYGDAALNPNGVTVLMERLNRILAFDEQTGVVRCEAGVSVDDLLRTFLPRGWFPAVTPGTRFVTIGGAVAGDVHGKNHHRIGSFGTSVLSMVLVTANRETLTCSPERNHDLFRATIGGLGLTGVIQEVELGLRRVETAYIKGRNFKARDLDEAIALLKRHDATHEYSVAWINGTAAGSRLGESIVSIGNHAALADLDGDARRHPLAPPQRRQLRLPLNLPSWTMNSSTIRAFNALYALSRPIAGGRSSVDYDAFFYPLDRVHDWNRVYGRRGFIQYQCAIPDEGGPAALRSVLEHCHRLKIPSSLGVLKRFGPAGGGLSFPIPGYTLSLDIPFRWRILPVLDELDRMVIEAGGRVNLGKDARLSPQAFRAMYPDYPRWLAVKVAVDPGNRFSSALATRLQLARG